MRIDFVRWRAAISSLSRQDCGFCAGPDSIHSREAPAVPGKLLTLTQSRNLSAGLIHAARDDEARSSTFGFGANLRSPVTRPSLSSLHACRLVLDTERGLGRPCRREVRECHPCTAVQAIPAPRPRSPPSRPLPAAFAPGAASRDCVRGAGFRPVVSATWCGSLFPLD